MRKLLVPFSVLFAIFGIAWAQDVSLFDPSTWFVSVEAVMTAASLITPWIVKLFTALGKDWFKTDGKATVWLSFVVSVLIAGVGGYLALGVFAGSSGLMGALNATFVTLVAFLGSNAMAKNERQVATAAAVRLHAKLEETKK